MALLDLTPSWTKNKPQVKSKKALSTDTKDIKQHKRDIWLNLSTKNPELSKTEIRKLAPDVYAWLYRHDRQWLNKNSPKLRNPKASENKVDWNQRDREILEQVKDVVRKIKKIEKPIGITVGRIGKNIELKALLDKHLDKLPKTRNYLELVTETLEDYQIRRVQWAVKELNDRGEEIKEWKILRLAGLRKDLSDDCIS